jgi:hypothetical protein
MSTTGKILAKGCNATGIDEQLIRRLHDKLGHTVMAIVELQSTSRTEDSDGDETVSLSILSLEPAQHGFAEDQLREIQRALYIKRSADGEQRAIDETLDDPRSLEDVMRDSHLTLLGGDDE